MSSAARWRVRIHASAPSSTAMAASASCVIPQILTLTAMRLILPRRRLPIGAGAPRSLRTPDRMAAQGARVQSPVPKRNRSRSGPYRGPERNRLR
jgi:hypothetical protein